MVHTCSVDDGAGRRTVLVDADGCAQDKYLLGNIEYADDLIAGKESHVFKYADKPNLYFNCQISIIMKEPGSICPRPKCHEPERGKRQAEWNDDETIFDVSSNSVRTSKTSRYKVELLPIPNLVIEENSQSVCLDLVDECYS
uniref:ZP domain-containing protein n=1 Tax=Romanomermis culicivorax TaxID=13658 RepID=A0A915IRZ3_ROMCU